MSDYLLTDERLLEIWWGYKSSKDKVDWWIGNSESYDGVKKISVAQNKKTLRLATPDIEAKEANDIYNCILDAYRDHSGWSIADVLWHLKCRAETRQALQGGEKG